MTHTLFRRGDVKSLEGDYVVCVMPVAGLSDTESKSRLARAFMLLDEMEPVNKGDSLKGSVFMFKEEDLYDSLKGNSGINAVYTDKEKIVELLKRLKDEDSGLSVVVSGLFNKVFDAAKRAGVKPYAVELSLGVWGKTELLPSERVLEITTMCGHDCVSEELVRKLMRKMKEGKITLQEAGEQMAKRCICGAFNPARAEELLVK